MGGPTNGAQENLGKTD